MKRLLLAAWVSYTAVSLACAGEVPAPPPSDVLPPVAERLPRPSLTPEPGIRGLGLGSAWNRGADGVITGVCPGATAPSSIGSAGLAPLSPPFVPSYGGGLGVSGPETQAFGSNSPVYGSTYGENLGTAQGSVLAQSSAVLGTPCPPAGIGSQLPAAPILNIAPPAPPLELVPR